MKSKNLQVPQKEIEGLESARTMARGQLDKRRCWDPYFSNECNSTFSARTNVLMKGVRSSEMPSND